jgi:AP-3 complex subunit mu
MIVAPLFVIEFLHRIMDVFEDYFGECTETALKDNYVIVYEVKSFLEIFF